MKSSDAMFEKLDGPAKGRVRICAQAWEQYAGVVKGAIEDGPVKEKIMKMLKKLDQYVDGEIIRQAYVRSRH